LIFDPSKFHLDSAWDISQLVVPEDYYLIEPKLLNRGGRMILGGLTKVGKSYITLSIIRSMLLGEPLFGYSKWQVKAKRVLLLEKEVGRYGLKDRLTQVFADNMEALKDNFFIVSQPIGFTFSDPKACDELKAKVDDMGIDLIIIDPINRFHFWKENDNEAMTLLVERLQALQEEKIGVICTHHFSKPPKGLYATGLDPLNMHNFRGANKLIEDASCIFAVDRQKGSVGFGWKLHGRFIVRHGVGEVDDFALHINEYNDGKCVYHGSLETVEAIPPPKTSIFKKKVIW
jgi:hypothetical protein